MELKSLCRKWVIAGTLFIGLVKLMIRPLYPVDAMGSFILGITPNLAGSFLIPFAAYWFFSGKEFLLARIFRLQTLFNLNLICLLGFAGLVVNEYLQKIAFFGRTFDYFDIVASFAGLFLSRIIFSKLMQRRAAAIT
jgi:hypothetical protein